MTVVSFGGPFLILVVVRGGASADWPPDRAIEWITIGWSSACSSRSSSRLRDDRLLVSPSPRHEAGESHAQSVRHFALITR